MDTNKYFNYYLRCLCTHWVFALDKSGSMSSLLYPGGPTVWSAAKDVLDSFYLSLHFLPFHYTSFYTFDHVAHLPEYLHQAPTIGQATDALAAGSIIPGGGTSFNNALLRAIDLIELYLFENTCFVMISDGFSSEPLPATITQFIGNFKQIRSNGCNVCSVCLFIRRPDFDEKKYYYYNKYCLELNIRWVEADEKNYQYVFSRALYEEKQKFEVNIQKSDDLKN